MGRSLRLKFLTLEVSAITNECFESKRVSYSYILALERENAKKKNKSGVYEDQIRYLLHSIAVSTAEHERLKSISIVSVYYAFFLIVDADARFNLG